MALSDFMLSVMHDQLEKVLALNVPTIDEAAKKIAFYSAMIDAALDDPMDDPEDQTDTLAYMRAEHQKLVEQYQQLVNAYL